MADQWELICHYTYSGTARVINDMSPQHKSPGSTVNIDDSDFIDCRRADMDGCCLTAPKLMRPIWG